MTEYLTPSWVHWIAQDLNGHWWGYEAEPNMSHDGWYENEVGQYCFLGKAEENPEWQTSCQKIAS
jgi:hypothetical protein